MAVLVIATNDLRSLFRERLNLFFVFLLPLLLIVVLGSTVSTSRPGVRLVATADPSPAAAELVARLVALDSLDVTVDDDLDDAVARVQRGDLSAVVVVPDDYGDLLERGETVVLDYLALPDSTGMEVRGVIDAEVAEVGTELRTVRAVEAITGDPVDAGTIDRVSAAMQPIEVVTVDDSGEPFRTDDLFGTVAAQELVLFLFTISMAASASVIQARRLGVIRRMAATRTTTTQIVSGQLLGRYLISLVQAAFIIGSTSLLFGLTWGSWPATLLVVLLFCGVSASVAVLLGAVAANENQATAIGISLGMALAAFGGCMVPLEIFPGWLRVAAHVTPHAWAVDAFTTILQRGGDPAEVATELAVLAVYATATVVVGSLALRRTVNG